MKRPEKEWRLIEFFSGHGRISTLAAKAGFPVASFDVGIISAKRSKRRRPTRLFQERRPMDINGEVGFAFLVALIAELFLYVL